MATAASKKQLKEKEKAESRKRIDEVKSLALRQGYVTEDQIVYLLDDWSLAAALLVSSAVAGFDYFGSVAGAVVTEAPGTRA